MGVRRKGQWNIPLIVGALVLLGSMPFLQTGIAGAAELVLQQKVFANRASLHASAVSGYMEEDYIPEAVDGSVYQASYETASEGGGEDWGSGPPAESAVRSNLERRIGEIMGSRYMDGNFNGLCRFDGGSSSFSVEETGEGLEVTSDVGNPPTVRCWAKGNNVTVPLSSPSETTYPGNRYFMIYEEMSGLVEDVRGALDSVNRREFTSTGESSCGGTRSEARRNARDNAEDDAEDYVRTAFDFFMDGAEVEDPLVISRSSISVSTTSSAEGDTTSEDCSCDPVYEEDEDGNLVLGEDGEPNQIGTENCDTEYNAVATAEPTSATASLGVRDTADRIPTSDGLRNLEFLVETSQVID